MVMKSLPSIVIAIFLCVVSMTIGPATGIARAQSGSGMASDDRTLQEGLKQVNAELAEIKKQLAEIRQLLSQRPAPPAAPAPSTSAKVNVTGSPSLGQSDAPVVIVEFSDYQCPFCQRFAQTTLPGLKTDYIEAGKVRYVFRDFPIASIHPQAHKAAEAAHCAGDQGKYWEMHHRLFQNQRSLGLPQIKVYARDAGLDMAAFEACLDQGKYTAKVEKNVADGGAAGISGTPSFVVGKLLPDGTIEGSLIRGAQPITAFRQAIDRLLDGKAQ
jgi:protein-disulfide isomerase